TWDGALAFQYHYNVLPSSIISRFIVRMHQYVHKHTLWRTGAVLKNDANKALVKADLEDRKIFIRVSGPEHSRRRFLEVIRSHFDSIHKTIPGIIADEKVPLPTHPEIAVDYKHLLRLEAKGITDWIPEGLEDTVNVKALLDGIETEQARRERQEHRLRDDRPERLSPRASSQPPVPSLARPVAAKRTGALEELARIKTRLDASSERFARRCLLAYLAGLIVIYFALAALIYKLGWNTMEPWTYFIGIGAFVGTYAYFAITQRELSPGAIYDQLVEMKKRKNYQLAGFDLDSYRRLTEQAGA
ncbi:MAG TPA: COR domain-containing protein, partial [Pyrinomonadaceae bacterium]|nr:COR domain-containing protein [Pyrinomonadaceae bacterium]